MPEGTVALAAYGDPSALDAFAAWLRRGPSHASVMKVDETWSEEVSATSAFEIVY
jgi:acylphosphatase